MVRSSATSPLLLRPLYTALVSCVAAEIEHVPRPRVAQMYGRRLITLSQVLMIQSLVFLTVIPASRFELWYVMLASAPYSDIPTGRFGCASWNLSHPGFRPCQLTAIPAKIVVIAHHIREICLLIIRLQHRDVSHGCKPRGVHGGVSQIVQFS